MPFTALVAAAALATPPLEHRVRQVPLTELIGSSPAAVAGTFGSSGAEALRPAFAAHDGGSVVTVARLDLRHTQACSGYARLVTHDYEDYAEYFIFRDARLIAVTRPGRFAATGLPTKSSAARREMAAARKRPAGPLPLTSGVSTYVRALEARGLPPGESLHLLCREDVPVTPVRTRRPPGPASILGAPLSLLTLAYWSPVYAAQALDKADSRSTAQANRPLALAVRLGEPLPAGFAKRKGVRWHQDEPGYAVATLDLGSVTGRSRDFETFGIRDGRVEWIGMADRGLCQDAERRPSAAREGCTETGHYNP